MQVYVPSAMLLLSSLLYFDAIITIDRMVMVSSGNASDDIKTRQVDLVPGKRYYIEAMVKCDANATTAGVGVSHFDGKNTIYQDYIVPSDGQWYELVKSYEAPLNGQSFSFYAFNGTLVFGTSVSVKDVKIGEQMLVVSAGTGVNSLTRRELSLEPDTTYFFSYEMRRGLDSGTDRPGFRITHNNATVLAEGAVPLDGQWHAGEAVFTTLGSGTYQLYLYNRYATANSEVELRRHTFDKYWEIEGDTNFKYETVNVDLIPNRKYDLSIDLSRHSLATDGRLFKVFNKTTAGLTELVNTVTNNDDLFYTVYDSFYTIDDFTTTQLYLYNNYAPVGTTNIASRISITSGFDRTFTSQQTSHFEHNDREAGVDSMGYDYVFSPDTNPILHGTQGGDLSANMFDSERELYGYKPRFMPGEVHFDAENRPWIRTGEVKLGADGVSTTHIEDNGPSYIQTLDNDGRWVTWNIKDILDGTPGITTTNYIIKDEKSPFTRILSDKAGNVYTVVREAGGGFKTYLLYLPYNSEQWIAVKAPSTHAGNYTLEPTDTYSDVSSPPMCINPETGKFYFISIGTDGKPDFHNMPIYDCGQGHQLTPFLNPPHSGAGPATVVVDDYVYIAYSTLETDVEQPGMIPPNAWTAQFFRKLDRNTGTFSPILYIGAGESAYTNQDDEQDPDNHNGPSLIMDKDGKLIFLTGAHQEYMYTYTTNGAVKVTSGDSGLDPTNINNWGPRTAIYTPSTSRTDSGLTYTAFLNDQVGTNGWCLATRDLSTANINSPMKRTLTIIKNGGDCKDIVVPEWGGYSIFYHRLTQDKLGRLFLSYMVYQHELTAVAKAAYIDKWPETDPDGDGEPTLKMHDPVIIFSEDFGDTWKFAKTEDFLDGMHQRIEPLK